jgi:hypothetical protein
MTVLVSDRTDLVFLLKWTHRFCFQNLVPLGHTLRSGEDRATLWTSSSRFPPAPPRSPEPFENTRFLVCLCILVLSVCFTKPIQ